MKYQVLVVGEPMQDFLSIKEAIDYASRHVYLSQDKGKELVKALENNKSVAYSYGFKEVAIDIVQKDR